MVFERLGRLFGGGREPARASARQRLSAGEWPAAIYAIGDIHGCLDELKALEASILEDARAIEGEKWLVTLGDYVDRGPASFGTVAHLMAPPPAGFRRVSLAGNHEQMLLDALANPQHLEGWLEFGGIETARSYGIAPALLEARRPRQLAEALASAIPQSHLNWLANLPSWLMVPGMLFVHAGIRPGLPLEAQRDEDLLWIRGPFLEFEGDASLTVVHGHTPSTVPVLAPGRICIDTGAFATGILTAARFRPGEPPHFIATGT